MKKILTLLSAVVLASTALIAEAASPRAAEDINSPVAAADTPVPKVRKASLVTAKHAKAKPGVRHVKATKVAHKRHARVLKAKKRKVRLHRH